MNSTEFQEEIIYRPDIKNYETNVAQSAGVVEYTNCISAEG